MTQVDVQFAEAFPQQLFLNFQEELEIISFNSISANNLAKKIGRLLPQLSETGPAIDVSERPTFVYRKDPAQPGKLLLKFSSPVQAYVFNRTEAEQFCASLAAIFKWRKVQRGRPSRAKNPGVPKPPPKQFIPPEARKRYSDTNLANYHARRALILKTLGAQCVTCGLTENLKVRIKAGTEKEVNLKRLSFCPDSYLAEVLPHLELVCIRKHEGEHLVAHGMWYAAYKIKCKCEDCAEFRANYALERREDRRAKKLAQDDAPC